MTTLSEAVASYEAQLNTAVTVFSGANTAANDASTAANASKVAAAASASSATLSASSASASATAAQTSGSAVALASNLAAGAGAGLVGFTASGAGAVTRTLQSKQRDSISARDFGALADGSDDAAKFTLAAASSAEVHVYGGAYTLATTPAVQGVLLEVHPGATLSGAGAAALGHTNGAIRETIHNGTAPNQFATRYIRRNANHTGGNAGFVSSGLRVDTYVSANVTNYEWAVTACMDNSSAAGQNVAGYFRGTKRAAGPTWGAVIEVIDMTGANPTSGAVALEIDVNGNGTDNNLARIGIDIVFRKEGANPTGASCVGSYGVRIQNGNEPGSKVTVGYGFMPGMIADVGFDTSVTTINQAAFKLATNQVIAWDAASTNTTSFDTVGIAYAVAGVKKSRLSNVGGIELFGLRTNISGTFSTGAQTPTLGANKPGAAGGGPATWLSVTIDGGQFWIPAWSN